MSTMTTLTCTMCGTEFEREIPEGRFGKSLLRMPCCDPCSDAGIAAREVEEEADEAREHAERLRRRRDAAGVPARLQNLGWGDLALDERRGAIDAARRWVRGELPALVLAGSVGVGKTRIAATAAWTMLESRSLRWVSVPVLFARLSGSFGPQRDAALELLTGERSLCMPIVLDDLDKVNPTAHVASNLFAAIDERLQRSTPILVTTNLGLGAIEAKFPEPHGQAIASRLAERSVSEVYLLEGRDRRIDIAA